MIRYNIRSFLPNDKPLQNLPSFYALWEGAAKGLPILNQQGNSRTEIGKLPLLSTDHLVTIEQWRRAYVVLSFLAHSYVWNEGLDNAINILPKNLAIPYMEVSKKLGLPPVLTHAAVDLWNWRLKDNNRAIELENLELINSFTDTESERTFYLVMTEIEALGSEIIPYLVMVPEYICSNDIKNIRNVLEKFNLVMTKIINTLSKMYLTCQPGVFYNELRKFLNGWGAGNIADGLMFEDVLTEPIKCNGGSAAQSSLIQLFDIIFGVEHPSQSTNDFLTKMRHYMPGEHREFLQEIGKQMNKLPLNKYIVGAGDDNLINIFNQCIENLALFRSRHMSLVHAYIIKMIPPGKTNDDGQINDAKGTGGTELVSFLKTCREETVVKKLNNVGSEISENISTNSLNKMTSKQHKNLEPIDNDMDGNDMDDSMIKGTSSIENNEPKSNNVVTPWKVEGNVDYQKLIDQFGTELITEELKQKFARITGNELHPWIKRGIFFSHRALDKLLDAYANGEPVFLYTGRGPSNEMHMGHLIPFMFTKWLQDVFDCPLVIQIADDEKYYFKPLEFQDVYRLGFENAKDIIACGFNPKKTFIFSNRDYRLNVREFENFVSVMKKNITAKQVSKVFGFGERIEIREENGGVQEHYIFNGDVTVGMMDWPFYQSAAAFSQAFPHIFNGRHAHCLVGYALDQDPYFRMARDLADKMGLIKPYSIMCTFIPPLTGLSGKMSSSVGTDATLFLTDNAQILHEKILKYAYSGGGGDGTLADHKKYGGNPDVDISYQYLRYFEFDDDVLVNLEEGFKKGDISCSEMKNIMANKIIELFEEHQKRRKLVTDEILKEFYELKPIELPKARKTEQNEQEKELYELLDKLSIKYNTLYHEPITTMQEGAEIAKKLQGIICKNLLLQGKDNTFYLYITDMNTLVNMKTLPKKLGIPKIRFAEKGKLQQLLNVPLGCATIFGIINNKSDLTIVIDDSVPNDKHVNFHPLRNDATTTISYHDMITFINYFGYKLIKVPVTDVIMTNEKMKNDK